MGSIFADRIADVPRSFIREILKVAVDRSIISFAGGLPNRELFPLEEIRAAADRVLREAGRDVLQYATSEGYGPLREWIANRYAAKQSPTARGLVVTSSTSSEPESPLLRNLFALFVTKIWPV